jgi:WD40 repeat protein
MSLASLYPPFPPIARGSSCPLKTDIKKEKLIYRHGKAVVIRDIEPAADGKINTMLYTQHQWPVTAACMAPSGCYVASGDDHGNLRVWACDTPDQILKLECPLFAGEVLDIAWSGDSQRILAVGNGGSVFGRVIMWDSGNSVGEVSGHQKKINSCDFKTSRPFRLVTGGEDNKVNFHEGPPFKFKATPKTHERFVNTTRFSPDGARFFSVSSDSFVCVFDGKEGSLVVEKKVHAGSIFDAAWSSDSAQILTCSGDGSCKVLDASTLDEVCTFNFKSGDRKRAVAEQQIGCAWGKPGLLSYALGGELSLFRAAGDAAPALVQYGHHKAINALAYDSAANALYSGSFCDATGTLKGVLLQWDISKGVAAQLEGEPHSNGIIGIAICGGTVVTCATDDSVMFSTPPSLGTKVEIGACPVAMAASASLCCVVTTTDKLVAFSVSTKAKVAEAKLAFSPTCVSVAPSDGMVAVGGEDNNVHVLNPDGTEKLSLARHKDKISCVAFAPKSDRIASGCANKEVVVWDATEGTPLVTGLQGFHTARIACLAWSPEGVALASGGVDAQIIVWDLENKAAKQKLPLAHTAGAIRSLCFASATELYSGGGDATIKKWAL